MFSAKNILIVGPDYKPPKGGIAQCVYLYDKLIYEDFRYVANSCEGARLRKIWRVVTSLCSVVLRLITEKDIQIVHIHTASNNSFRRSALFIRLAKAFHKKVVIHIHGGGFKDYYARHSAFVIDFLLKCDAIITLSPSWKCFVERVSGHGNVCVIPNIVDYPVMKDVPKDGIFHILFLGQITKNKGIFDLLELFNEKHVEYSGRVVLDIGGGMFDIAKMEKYITDNGLHDVVKFHGWVSGDEKTDLLNLADAFILPSYIEGMPISIIEAESYGLPVLSTTVGAIPEMVQNGENGYLFVPGDKAAIGKAIADLISDDEIREKMGNKSRQLCEGSKPVAVESKLFSLYSYLLH